MNKCRGIHDSRVLVTVGLLATLVIGACTKSGADAPMVTLPAPVTGKITISEPDEEGAVTITGDAGAVTADVTVMAINRDTADETGLLDGLAPNWLVSEAWAQSFPDVCERTGRGCALADGDGAFSMNLIAEEGHEIDFVIIDATKGTERSERLRRRVLRNLIPFARVPRDVTVIPSTEEILVLLSGNQNQGTPGRVVSVAAASRTRTQYPFSGTAPSRLLYDEGQFLILDRADNFLALVDEGQRDFENPTQIDLPAQPNDMALNEQGTVVLVSLQSQTQALARVDLTQQTITDTLDLSDQIEGYRHLSTHSLSRGSQAGQEIFAALSRFRNLNTDEMHWGLTLVDQGLAVIRGPVVASSASLELVDLGFIDEDFGLLASDSGLDQIFSLVMPEADPANVEISLNELDLVTADPEDVILNPRAVAVDLAENLAFVAAQNNSNDRPDTILTIDLASLEVVDVTPMGLNPGRLYYDQVNQVLHAIGLNSRTVARLPLSALLEGSDNSF